MTNSSKADTSLKLISVFLGIITVILVIYVLKVNSGFILPIVIALLLARLSEPVISWFKRRRLSVGLGIIAVVLGAIVLIGLIGAIFTICADQLATTLPHYNEKATALLHSAEESLTALLSQAGYTSSDINSAESIQPAKVLSVVGSGFGSAFSFFSTSLIVLFMMLMMIAGQEAIMRGVKSGYGESTHKKVVDFFHTIDEKVQRFLIAKTIVNLITASATFVILTLFGLDLAFVFAVLTFFLSYIPAVGGLLALLLPITLSVLQFDHGGMIGGMIAALLVMNTTIDRFIEPKLLGQSMDLSPLIVFLSFVLFTWMWGSIGAIIAVPITAIMKAAFEATPSLRPIAMMMGTGR